MELLALDAAAKDQAIQAERDRLQGGWAFVSGIREAELWLVGDHFALKFDNGDLYIGTYQLDPTQKPRAMDMTVLEGPARHRGRTSLCIYDHDGFHLTWCPGPPGGGERPQDFPREDTEQLCVVFRRAKPHCVTDFLDE
jgi:uncharacterized protein (TIGR03067 family)